jgi:hypothetical protein
MTTEALAFPLAARKRRPRMKPGLVPILVGSLACAAWVGVMEPFAVIRAALRQGAGASYELLFVAAVSAIGIGGIAVFAVAVTGYVLAMRSMRRAG